LETWPSILVALGGAYLAASGVLLRWPTLLHPRRKQNFRVVHGSHRGGAGEQLENTLRAFEHAAGVLCTWVFVWAYAVNARLETHILPHFGVCFCAALGTDLLELDVHLSGCGLVVVSHDRHLVGAFI
jgi:hypothetical protein